MQLRRIAHHGMGSVSSLWTSSWMFFGKLPFMRRLELAHHLRTGCTETRSPSAPLAKVKQLAHHLGAALGAGLDHVEQLGLFRVLFLEHAHAHEHRRQCVVQIVRHAAGQRAQALQPLRAQLLALRRFIWVMFSWETTVRGSPPHGKRSTRHRCQLGSGPRWQPYS